MKTSASTLAAASLIALLAATTAQAQDVGTILKNADSYRMGSDNLQVDTLVQVFNTDGTPDKERRYTVFAQSGRQSLVLMQSPAEKGQKVLMLGDDFWLLMPNSQRPLRITRQTPRAAKAGNSSRLTHSGASGCMVGSPLSAWPGCAVAQQTGARPDWPGSRFPCRW